MKEYTLYSHQRRTTRQVLYFESLDFVFSFYRYRMDGTWLLNEDSRFGNLKQARDHWKSLINDYNYSWSIKKYSIFDCSGIEIQNCGIKFSSFVLTKDFIDKIISKDEIFIKELDLK